MHNPSEITLPGLAAPGEAGSETQLLGPRTDRRPGDPGERFGALARDAGRLTRSWIRAMTNRMS